MSLYQFNEIYYKTTGEYDNDVQILFYSGEASDMLVVECGCFYLVNKPAEIRLEGFDRYPENRGIIYKILRIAEISLDEIYIEMEGALIRIAWYFSTTDGQQVKGFWLFTEEGQSIQYQDSLKALESAYDVEITDLRFS